MRSSSSEELSELSAEERLVDEGRSGGAADAMVGDDGADWSSITLMATGRRVMVVI